MSRMRDKNKKYYSEGDTEMKKILLQYSDSDFKKLRNAKVKTFLTWEHFILKLLKGGVKNGNNKI